jgi:Bifunctional DNA primase/polymerase, N-terminal
MSRQMGQTERAAHSLAEYGWHVLQVAPNGKTPAIRSAHEPGNPCEGECGQDGHGFKDATVDHRTIERWWSARPDCNVGIRTGSPYGPDVLDIDRHGDASGFPALSRLMREGLVQGPLATIRTPSAGQHWYFEGTGQGNGHMPKQHIDFRSQGGYVVAPPSKVGGRAYQVVGTPQRTGQTVDWQKVQNFLEPPQCQVYVPQQPGSEHSSVDRIVGFVSRQEHGNRNGSLHWATHRLIDARQMTPENMQRLIDASVRSGIRGGAREAERTIQSAIKARQAGRQVQHQPG